MAAAIRPAASYHTLSETSDAAASAALPATAVFAAAAAGAGAAGKAAAAAACCRCNFLVASKVDTVHECPALILQDKNPPDPGLRGERAVKPPFLVHQLDSSLPLRLGHGPALGAWKPGFGV